jgi:hypothetical protein
MITLLSIKKYLFLFAFFLYSNFLNAQCAHHVTHTSGTSTVNDIQVTVSSTGLLFSNSMYCQNFTQPYGIGAGIGAPTGYGSYTFQFSSPVDSLHLNFSGINNNIAYQEVIKLFVNGQHYAIPSAGSLNCDSMAVLTPNGNITGAIGSYPSGWNETVITGPIHTLTVMDTIITGSPGGILFGLYLCNKSFTAVEQIEAQNFNVYPNPSTGSVNIELDNIENPVLNVYDLNGRLIFHEPTIKDSNYQFDLDAPSGVYIIELKTTKEHYYHKLIRE